MAGEDVRDEWQGKRCGMTRARCDAIIEGQELGINLLFFVSAAAASCACSLRSNYNRNMVVVLGTHLSQSRSDFRVDVFESEGVRGKSRRA